MAGKKRQTTLPQRMREYIRKNRLISGKQKVLVGVSGGPDSVCLLHILTDLQNELHIDLHVAHLDHGLRGTDSEADAAYVADIAASLGIPSSIEKRDIPAYQTENRISLEEAAREVRYAFLAEVAHSVGADIVAVGHTANDHIETVLLHIVRGTGTKGLIGLKPLTTWPYSGNNLTLIRPLLEINRKEIHEYCRLHQLSPREDASNLSFTLLRNRIRHELIPLLQRYNPQVSEAILRLSSIAADDISLLDKASDKIWNKIIIELENSIIISKKEFLELPGSLKRHILRLSIEKLVGNLKDIETRHIEEIIDTLNKPAGKMLNLPYGLVFVIEYDRYILSTDIATLSPFPLLEREFKLNIPGETNISGWKINASITGKENYETEKSNYTAFLDFDKTGNNLSLRSRKRGDRFQPLGMSQQKKIGQFMIDARIPKAWRERVPIVCVSEQILWIVGHRIDDRLKVTNTTKQVLRLEFKQI